MHRFIAPSVFALTLAAPSVGTAAEEPSTSAAAAAAPTLKDSYGKGIRVNLSEDGKSYFRFMTWHQIWARYQQFNPNSTVNGQPADAGTDIGLRRSRVLMFGQLHDRVLVLTHFGINNQTFTSGAGDTKKPQVFIHAAWADFKVVERHLHLGAGLHYWHGISRMTNASTHNFLALDAPILNWPTIELQDQFARQLGFFAKGKIHKLDYRLALNKPFTPQVGVTAPVADADGNVPDEAPGTAGVMAPNQSTSSWQVAGYLNWQFLDEEANTLPYTVGTYVGSKRVLNLGFGFQYQPEAMARYSEAGATDDTVETDSFEQHAITALGVDLFADLPLGDNGSAGALTGYGAFYHYDFGPDFVRNIGIMNYAAGGGNAYPLIGTGNHIYAQAGYVLPLSLGEFKIQPYADLQYSMMDGLDDAPAIIGAGVNWYVLGHYAKLTTHYRNRPVFTGTEATERASELILQTQILF